ncbi:MAG: MMPL family transporter [Gammaproteobacteria bacterium]|jgi:predicted RND superfamily exporter protein
MLNTLKEYYYKLCIGHPVITLLLVVLVVGYLALFIDRFRLDASADSLVLEHDKDLKYYRSIRARYGSDDFLIVTYNPRGELFSDHSLKELRKLQDDLLQLKRVKSVTSILNVPLIDSPRVTLSELRRHVRTLETPDTDKQLAKKEFLTSPLYSDLILSDDGETTALQVNFKRDEKYQELLSKRNALREQQLSDALTEQQQRKLEQVETEFKHYSASLTEQERADIAAVRNILDRYRDDATIYLGGIPMIVADMIRFISHDIEVFGVGVLCFLILLLGFSFKKPRWVLIPMLICFTAGVAMVGYLGLVEWPVTVVSSNFISLMLIITLSLTIHLIVRYQELQTQNSDMPQPTLIRESIRTKAVPSFYTAITTMVAFGSLLVSGIRPVIDFGWMMVYGVAIALVLAFMIFPATLKFLKPGEPTVRRLDISGGITRFFARLVQRYTYPTFAVYLVLLAISIYGVTQLSVENRFIDYFKDTTEIYQGMVTIDRKLGGTTPMDVILDPDTDFKEMQREMAESTDDAGDGFDAAQSGSAGISGNSYWFNIFQLQTVSEIQDYLESLPQTGKVLSIATTMDLLSQINGGPLDNFSLSIMYKRLPDDLRETLFDPYMAKDGNQVRFSIRIFESDPNLKRQQLLDEIRNDLVNKFDLEPQQVHITGMVVLYNNMLQSLFTSQILTIGVVFLAILIMFIVLFRSFFISILAIIPNIIAAGSVLGLMGLLGIPLDIMTITIAAITIGIAVDDTIHYIHRISEEFKKDGDYRAAVTRSHEGVGRAMFYTSIVITLGFSILVLSNFIPTIYFGLLTGVAMMVAMVANLTLLPVLLMTFKPLKAPQPASES